jgi:hypothetical protein
MALPEEHLEKLSPESERAFRQRFIEDAATGRIRFTEKGFAAYGARFVRAGIDINRVRTREELRCASVRSEWVLWEEVREMVKGHKVLEEILKPLWS